MMWTTTSKSTSKSYTSSGRDLLLNNKELEASKNDVRRILSVNALILLLCLFYSTAYVFLSNSSHITIFDNSIVLAHDLLGFSVYENTQEEFICTPTSNELLSRSNILYPIKSIPGSSLSQLCSNSPSTALMNQMHHTNT